MSHSTDRYESARVPSRTRPEPVEFRVEATRLECPTASGCLGNPSVRSHPKRRTENSPAIFIPPLASASRYACCKCFRPCAHPRAALPLGAKVGGFIKPQRFKHHLQCLGRSLQNLGWRQRSMLHSISQSPVFLGLRCPQRLEAVRRTTDGLQKQPDTARTRVGSRAERHRFSA